MSSQAEAHRNERLNAVLESVGRVDHALGRGPGSGRPPDDSQIAPAAAEFLELLDQLTDEDVFSLDRRVRSLSEYLQRWGHGGNLVRGFATDQPSTAQAAAAAGSFMVSGYTREKACRCLKSFMPWSFRLLAIRSSDWVPEVRAAALDSLNDVGPDEIASHLALVDHLSQGRSRGSEFGRIVEDALRSDAGSAALLRARQSAEVTSRRAAWKLLMDWWPDATLADLGDASGDSDVWLRQWAAGHARDPGVDAAVVREVVMTLQADPVGRLRARGVELGIELGVVNEDSLSAALSDGSSLVRSLVQHELRRAGIDVTAMYRARLEHQPAVGDLLGFGETADPGDASRLSPWLHDPRPGYRRAALVASVGLLGDRAVHTAAELLDDPNPRVAQTATRLLSRFHLPNDLVEQFQEQARPDAAPVNRRRVVMLLRPYPWRWLLAILRCLDDADEETRVFLKAELGNWHQRSARIRTGPPLSFGAEIQARLGAVDDQTAQWIAFVLRTSSSHVEATSHRGLTAHIDDGSNDVSDGDLSWASAGDWGGRRP